MAGERPLPRGWRFANRLLNFIRKKSPDSIPMTLRDTFTFDCRGGGGGCCGHADKCGHEQKAGSHRVGNVLWDHLEGRWQCAFLTADKMCGIRELRPLTCRLFPMGVSFDPDARVVYPWWTRDVESTCPECFAGRQWTVAEWLEASGSMLYIRRTCEALDRGERLLV